MAGTKISEATIRETLKGTEQIPLVDTDLPKGKVTSEILKTWIQNGLFKVEEDQHGGPVVILPKGTKIAAYRPDGTFQTLIFYAEYEEGDKQNEVGAANTHLNLNTDNTVTVDTSNGKKTLAYTDDVNSKLSGKGLTSVQVVSALPDPQEDGVLYIVTGEGA